MPTHPLSTNTTRPFPANTPSLNKVFPSQSRTPFPLNNAPSFSNAHSFSGTFSGGKIESLSPGRNVRAELDDDLLEVAEKTTMRQVLTHPFYITRLLSTKHPLNTQYYYTLTLPIPHTLTLSIPHTLTLSILSVSRDAYFRYDWVFIQLPIHLGRYLRCLSINNSYPVNNYSPPFPPLVVLITPAPPSQNFPSPLSIPTPLYISQTPRYHFRRPTLQNSSSGLNPLRITLLFLLPALLLVLLPLPRSK